MKKLTYKQLKDMWLDFYKKCGHTVIPSASVVPENDPSVLFTNSGMHPLVPFLLGEKHPGGVRLANVQKCVRTGDIDEVGNPTHLTFFEMLGNWSLGDYFKKEKIAWTYQFLTDKEYLAIDPERIFATCFEGDETAPKDEESAKYWMEQGVPTERIYFLPKSENWWQLPSGTGPQGPCTEVFMELKPGACGKDCNPSCDCGRFVEIGNDVFMQYVVQAGTSNASQVIQPAKQHNVDTGFGLERLLCLSNGVSSVYDTQLFDRALGIIEKNSGIELGKAIHEHGQYELESAMRVLAEHTRAATVIISDGVVPSNTGQGYVLRRLIRRAVRKAHTYILACNPKVYNELIDFFAGYLGEYYPEIQTKKEEIKKVFMDEVSKFEKTLELGMKEFQKVRSFMKPVKQELDKMGEPVPSEFSGKTAFRLYETYGFPIELTAELCADYNLKINMDEYNAAKEKHAKSSQTASAGAFKGGMADTTGDTTKLHTATHILHAALRKIYGEDLIQRGSNITPERLRFDFNIDHKMTPEEIKKVEDMVNDIISQKLPVEYKEMTMDQAKKMKAFGAFTSKYGDIVKVYSIGDFSVEFCGGPHVANTSELGKFKITKEESVSAGIRRIKGILVD